MQRRIARTATRLAVLGATAATLTFISHMVIHPATQQQQATGNGHVASAPGSADTIKTS